MKGWSVLAKSVCTLCASREGTKSVRLPSKGRWFENTSINNRTRLLIKMCDEPIFNIFGIFNSRVTICKKI